MASAARLPHLPTLGDLCWSFGGRATAWRLPLRNGDVVAFDRTANAAGLHSIEKKLDAAEDRDVAGRVYGGVCWGGEW